LKKKKHAEHENLERWLISYADFITLLFAFFVVMWSMRTDNPPNLAKIDGIKRAFNFIGQTTAAQETTVAIDPVGGQPAVLLVEPMYQNIQDGLKKVGVQGVTVHKVDRGVILRIPEEAVFGPGNAIIRETIYETLDKTGVILREFPNQIQVEGHTDPLPIKTSSYPSNWELSTARATAVARYFIERIPIPPEKFSVAGFAEYQPLNSNDTPEGRAKNRRVDILVVKEESKKKAEAPAASPGISDAGLAGAIAQPPSH
jgi:chemotaxis protein MotB